MVSDRVVSGVLGVIIAIFIVIGALYAIYTPPWQTPDEPAHYNYVAQIVEDGCCPVITPGDWDAAYLDDLKANHFPESADLTVIEYEDHQPPLYYLVLSLVYRLSGGNLLVMRLVSVLFGAGMVLAVYVAVARVLPHRRILALGAAAFAAFVPQHIAMMASVNNDSMAQLVINILIVVAITYLGNPAARTDVSPDPLTESSRPHAAALGGLAGVAFLAKPTIYLPAVIVVGVAILLRWRIERRDRRWLLTQIAWAGGIALLLGALWWGRNLRVYGWPDFFGQRAHRYAVVGQPRTAARVAAMGFFPYLLDFLTTTYHSFWGQFGWMGVPMPPRFYLVIGLFLLLDAAGLIILLRRMLDDLPSLDVQRAGLITLAVVLVGTLIVYAYYNITFVQPQGRYLFPAVAPLGLLIAGGLRGWALLLLDWLPGERLALLLRWLPLIGLIWMPVLTVYALFKFIVPYLH